MAPGTHLYIYTAEEYSRAVVLVFRYRVKSLTGLLNRQSRAVNYVWNYCNETQKHALTWNKRWPSGFDFNRLTSGCAKELGLHSGTVNAVCEQYAKSRSQHRRPYLRYRGVKSLAWVPLKGRDLKREGNAFRFAGNTFRVFHCRALSLGRIKDGTNFSRDRRGHWFLNIVVELADVPPRGCQRSVGIDLGLKRFATLSTGEKIANPGTYHNLEKRLRQAQRAGKKQLATKLHAKATHRRRDFLHKLSHRIVREFDYIAVGNVNAGRLAKTGMAKCVHDASWSSFRAMLAYKAVKHGARYEEIDERFSSQVRSSCGSLPTSRPNGIADLGIRQWICSDCGHVHDRDVNSALNILARSGHRTPVEGITDRTAA
jgi:IS605 OrfB family transposase